MGLYCHVCHKIVDLPARGEYKSILHAGLTTPDTYQCLDSKCWKFVRKEDVHDAADLDEYIRLRDLANASRRERMARIRAGDPPRDLEDLQDFLTTRHDNLVAVRDGQGGDEQGTKKKTTKSKKEKKAKGAKEEQDEGAADVREYRHALNRGHRRGRDPSEVGSQDDDEDYDDGNPVIENRPEEPQIEQAADHSEDDDDDDDGGINQDDPELERLLAEAWQRRQQRRQQRQERQRALGQVRELIDAMLYAGIPGVLYDEQGRPYYNFVEVDDGGQYPRNYNGDL